ncbi:IS5 family transposase [Streptomyces sp. NPDC005989]|uniref:IS5 family transposase n=1 Tax=Streptomyces sp. NPDC005989 TaxID=3156727 RepID=UPI0033FD55CB
MGSGSDLTNAQWERLEPFLPMSNGRCGRWRDHRQVVNGLLFQMRTGVQWRDLPERYGPWKTAHERHRRWSADGTRKMLLRRIQAEADAAGEIDRDISVDSTSVRAHHHAAGARHAPPLSADGRCRVLSLVITPGQCADCTRFEPVMDNIRVPRPACGRPRTKPNSVSADKGYSNRRYGRSRTDFMQDETAAERARRVETLPLRAHPSARS